MKYNIDSIENQLLNVQINLEENDVMPAFDTELKNFGKKANIKGFRTGKAPASFIKKMYGKGILADLLSKKISESLNEVIKNENLRLLADPVQLEEENLSSDIYSPESWVFKFEMGIAPEFEIQGLNANDSYIRYDIEVTEQKLEEEFQGLRFMYGVPNEIKEGKITPQDSFKVTAKELENGEIKAKGWDTAFVIKYNDVEDEILNTELKDKGIGDKFTFNPYKLTKGSSERWARTNILNIGEEETDINPGDSFEGTITEIYRYDESIENEAFFTNIFNSEEIKTHEEAKDRIKSIIESNYKRRTQDFSVKQLEAHLKEINKPDLPERFLKKMYTNKNNENGELTAHDLFHIKEDIRWSLLMEKLTKKYNLTVSNEEVARAMYDDIANYYGGGFNNSEFVSKMIMDMMKDKETVSRYYNGLLTNKLITEAQKEVVVEDKPISLEEYVRIENEFFQKLNNHDHHHDHEHDHDHKHEH